MTGLFASTEPKNGSSTISRIPPYDVRGIFYDRDAFRFHHRDERVEIQFNEGQTDG